LRRSFTGVIPKAGVVQPGEGSRVGASICCLSARKIPRKARDDAVVAETNPLRSRCQSWYARQPTDCWRSPSVLKAKDAQMDARAFEAPHERAGERWERSCTRATAACVLRYC